ncbi:MAG: hypothetical protein QOI80_1039 [Solirubrobacteraceae bacterium]|nr:hypothetical protein [Solirubrobacteraceae bacterium]
MRRLRRDLDLSELTRLLPATGVLVVWTVLMFNTGGYDPDTWMPAGLVLLALLVLAVASAGRLLPATPTTRRALLILIAFTAWCFISLIWSDARGPAWEAADLLLVALAGVWTLALAPWRTRTATVAMIAFSAAAGVVCIVALLTALQATDLTSRFEDFRFSPPLDYPNTTAAFAFMAAMPPLLLAARPDASIPAKALGQGLATFLAAYALLPQSRGSILGGLAAVVVLALTVPFRWRLTLHALLLALAVLIAAGPVGDVYSAASESGKASGALGDALTAILIATAAGVVGGLALAVAEDRVVLDEGRKRTARIAGIAAAALVALAIAGVGVAKSSSISDTLSDQWRSLKHPGIAYGGEKANGAGSRLSSVDPLERYDYWRVSLDGFRANPLGGVGAGGFEHRYQSERRYPKPSRYPHNLVLKVLGDTGIVGAGLMLAFLIVLARGLITGTSALALRVRVIAATATAMLAYFLAHGLFDWLEAYPVLLGPALAFPLVALVVCGRAEHERLRRKGHAVPPPPAVPSRPVWAVAGVGAALAFLSLLGPWLSLRYRDRASNTWRTNVATAYRDLDRAAGLDPLSPQPYVLQGVIALSNGDVVKAQDGFRRALDREDQWLPHFALGAIAADAGDRALARRELEAAARLNVRDTFLPEVSKRVLSAKGLLPATALRDVLSTDYTRQDPIR